MSKDKLIPTADEDIMEITFSLTDKDRDIESPHSGSGREDRRPSRSPVNPGAGKKKTGRLSDHSASSSRDRAGPSGGTSGARGSRPQDERRKRRTRDEETQDKRKKEARDSDGWAQGQADLLQERLQFISGACLLYEILLTQNPLAFSSRQDLLSTALLHSFLQHTARKAHVFKNTRNLQVKEMEELNNIINSGPFGLRNIPEQWKSIKVQGIIYKHADTYAFWRNCPRQLPHALIRMVSDMRIKYGVQERAEHLKKAEATFGLSTAVHRQETLRVFNPFEREFTAPDPDAPECLARQLAEAKSDLARAKNSASKAAQEVKQLQVQVAENQKNLKESEGQVKALRSQLEGVMNQRADWTKEREQMVEEARVLQDEHSSLLVENSQLQSELKEAKARPQMVEKGELTALLQRLLPVNCDRSPPRRVVEEDAVPTASRNRIGSESDMD